MRYATQRLLFMTDSTMNGSANFFVNGILADARIAFLRVNMHAGAAR